MQKISLDNNLSLLLEADDNKLRLIIADSATELACRRETPGNLRRYLAGTQNQLFKGRLQLHKADGQVAVLLKRSVIGLIPIGNLVSAINDL